MIVVKSRLVSVEIKDSVGKKKFNNMSELLKYLEVHEGFLVKYCNFRRLKKGSKKSKN